jgi:hypothetical protein
MMPPETVKNWVLKIVEALETWPTMRPDNVEVAMVTETPSGALTYSVNTIPVQYREAVRAVLPPLTTTDFTVAAKQIRESVK